MPISALVRPRSARTGAAVAAALVGGLALADAPAAFAAPGDSGDLTVLSSGPLHGNSNRGGPVCKFRLAADNFDTLPAIPWTITSRPPTVPPGDTLTGTLPLSQGRARSAEYRLPDGTYELQWVVPGGVTKQKTFVVRCDEGKNPGRAAHHRPSGPVPAGGGGVPTTETVAASGDSHAGTTAALAVGAAGIAGLLLARRAARRRARGEA
ncbi:hypothetical protein [Streptomyces sp. NPDC020965]|uniref:hypothetical protein n=1 Tax=Streptomyces sp. NPDC020965 TaxID=3365105 RepID=UPI0037930D54